MWGNRRIDYRCETFVARGLLDEVQVFNNKLAIILHFLVDFHIFNIAAFFIICFISVCTVQQLLDRGLLRGSNAASAIGYRQSIDYLEKVQTVQICFPVIILNLFRVYFRTGRLFG